MGINEEASALVARWMGVRASRGITGRQTVFCTLSGEPVAPRYVRNLLRRLVRKAGVERRVNPHAFRHTLASELVAEGVNLVQIQHVLGHASLDGTAHYLRRIAPAELVELMSPARLRLTIGPKTEPDPAVSAGARRRVPHLI